jgi:hypothetical protein
MHRRLLLQSAGALLGTLWSFPSVAGPKDAQGFYRTGKGIRKKIMLFPLDLYDIEHSMKALPPVKSRRAVLESRCDKRFLLTLRRDLEGTTLNRSLYEGYGSNGYRDGQKIAAFLAPLGVARLPKGTLLSVTYNVAQSTTTLALLGRTASLVGEDFMKATWSLWLGVVPDQPELGDALIAELLRFFPWSEHSFKAKNRPWPARNGYGR